RLLFHCFTLFTATRPPPRPTLFPYTTLFRSPTSASVMTRTTRANSSSLQIPLFPPAASSCSIAITILLLLPTTPEAAGGNSGIRSEEHTSELQSRSDLVCRLLLEKKKKKKKD